MDFFNTRSITFDNPIEMLYACHSKVRRFCSQVQMLPGYIVANGRNDAALQAVKQISQYFNTAAPLHHQDEEEDLFPLLLYHFPHTRSNIEELQRQHESLHAGWAAVEHEFAGLLADPAYRLQTDVLQRFSTGYDAHLALEEPLFETGRNLPAQALVEAGRKMAERRKT
ncbi:hemerythrin domain-containing protein [Neisseria musculi]|uniref:Hemerythrin HHE cation binding domain protein n=1 Tax=Neisseria musculi TaxID=1815583 RepID=A0A7H1MEM7_9NEIS|nr:hemerythrin domain-containing protein [Neisseria musculi]QNT60092.1 hemerythrin HHE cation binding domain protein [Neisseria musculi]